MGVTRQDIFGSGDGAQPAAAGTYGEAPSGYRLPDGLRLGEVRLHVTSLERSLAFYQQVLGLNVLRRDDTSADLGAVGETRPLVTLVAGADATARARRQLGLYHFAILVPDRPSLGRFVRHLGENGIRAGASDHLVSEAFYLQDPDDHGIEVYADRPRDAWTRVNRELMMASDPVNLPDLLASAGEARWSGMPAGTVMGHLHLHVGDLDGARAFYSDGLGFDRMVWQYPGALFLAAGGYHHHLGTNTWAGPQARPAAPTAPRLLEWTIELPQASDIAALAEQLTQAGIAFERDGSALVTADPWGTQLRVRPAR